jgi:acetate kinase
MKILTLNTGSSSLKSTFYDLTDEELNPPVIWERKIDSTSTDAIRQVLESLWSGPQRVLDSPAEIDIVGHRVVHGGSEYRKSTFITPEVKAAIGRLAALAPAHNLAALRGIEAVEQLLGSVPQLAVFDTAFHRDIPDAAAIYPGPYEWLEQGIRRYGFHGINHQYCTKRAAQILQKEEKELRLLTCHLGNGCSMAAISGGRSVNTTMGFTPLEGLMMGSRSGSIDPGILLYLLRQGSDLNKIDRVLNQESGLKGISGVSSDMRQIEAAIDAGNERAQLAFDIFIHRARFHLGAMLPSLDRLDALVFTAGIGENSPRVRAAICEKLSFLGVELDPRKNSTNPRDKDIATLTSRAHILVIRAQEDWTIALECWRARNLL